MPRLRKIEKAGFRFIIYTNDHTPMHVHVWKAGAQLIVNFENELELRENYGMSKTDTRKAVGIISEQRMYLIEEWRRIHNNE